MRALTLISAFVGGAIVGCGAALLFAPERVGRKNENLRTPKEKRNKNQRSGSGCPRGGACRRRGVIKERTRVDIRTGQFPRVSTRLLHYNSF